MVRQSVRRRRSPEADMQAQIVAYCDGLGIFLSVREQERCVHLQSVALVPSTSASASEKDSPTSWCSKLEDGVSPPDSSIRSSTRESATT